MIVKVLVPSILLILVLTACGRPAAESDPPTNSPTQASQPLETNPPVQMEPEPLDTSSHIQAESAESLETDPSTDPTIPESKTLVVYFSRVGVTPFEDGVDASSSASINIRDGKLVGNVQYLAEFIVEETGGDLFQIITEKEYPVEYGDATDFGALEQKNGERPILISHVENMDQYDVIFLGYPNWWGTLPQAVVTFLEEYDFNGKTIVPFCSHGGSRLGQSVQDIAALCPDAEILKALEVRNYDVAGAQAEVQDWLNGLGLN